MQILNQTQLNYVNGGFSKTQSATLIGFACSAITNAGIELLVPEGIKHSDRFKYIVKPACLFTTKVIEFGITNSHLIL